MYFTPTLDDVCRMLKELDAIPRPSGDNAGDPINSDSVFYALYPVHQDFVNHLMEVLHSYTRLPGGQGANVRSITYLNRRGYPTYLGFDQYDAYRLVGSLTTENWIVDLSDQCSYDQSY